MTNPISAAREALMNYQQADMDGIMVLASRQAIHEVNDHIDAQDAKIKALTDALEAFGKHADKRKRKSIEGAVCFSQPLLIAAREALAAAKEPT